MTAQLYRVARNRPFLKQAAAAVVVLLLLRLWQAVPLSNSSSGGSRKGSSSSGGGGGSGDGRSRRSHRSSNSSSITGGLQLNPLDKLMACPRSDQNKRAWRAMHDKLALEVEGADAGQGWELIFYGDSLIEHQRGTQGAGALCPLCAGVPQLFSQHLESTYRVGLLGIGGDQTFHLMWRLQNGELPRRNHPRLALLLIGTNDLGAASLGGEPAIRAAAAGVVQRVTQLVALLHTKLPRTQVALLGLLPRGTPYPPHAFATATVCPGTKAATQAASRSLHSIDTGPNPGRRLFGGDELYVQPSIFTAALEDINQQLRELASRAPRLAFVGCGARLMLDKSGRIDPALMPDGLHPNAAGYNALYAKCWGPAVQGLLQAASE